MAKAGQLPLVPLTKTTFRIPADLHRRLKIRAVEQGRQMSDLLIEATELYLPQAAGEYTHERRG
jgi:predicted DNA-binding protein